MFVERNNKHDNFRCRGVGPVGHPQGAQQAGSVKYQIPSRYFPDGNHVRNAFYTVKVAALPGSGRNRPRNKWSSGPLLASIGGGGEGGRPNRNIFHKLYVESLCNYRCSGVSRGMISPRLDLRPEAACRQGPKTIKVGTSTVQALS